MSIESNVADSEQKLSRFVIALTLLLSFMALWLVFFRQTNHEISATNFSMLRKNFVEAVNLAHVEWMRRGKPDFAIIAFNNEQSASSGVHKVNMNKAGWPQPLSFDEVGCRGLWQALLNHDLTTIKQRVNVRVVMMQNVAPKEGSAQAIDEKMSMMCHYSFSDKLGFTYSPTSGLVLNI